MKKGGLLLVCLLSLMLVFSNGDVFGKSSSSSSSTSSFSGGGGSRSSSSYGSSYGSSSPSKSSFSGGGGSRSLSSQSYSSKNNNYFSTTDDSKKKSMFSGSTGMTKSQPVNTKFDSAARTAASKQNSAAKFDAYKQKNNIQTASVSSPQTAPQPPPASYGARVQQMRTVYKPSGYYTPTNTRVIYRDNYSNAFLQVATAEWLFHHWGSVDKSRFDRERLADLEYKMRQMEQQGMIRNTNYQMDGVSSDLTMRPQQPSHHKDDNSIGFVGWFVILTVLIVFGFVGYSLINKRKRWL